MTTSPTEFLLIRYRHSHEMMFWLASVAALFTSVCAAQSLPSLQAETASAAFAANGISVWMPGESGHDAMMSSVLGNSLSGELGPLGPLMPFSVVIRNQGAVAIRGILMRVTMIDARGAESWGPRVSTSGPCPFGCYHARHPGVPGTWGKDARRILSPGTQRKCLSV